MDRALILHKGRIVDDVLTDDLHENGETLLTRMASACGWDPQHYLQFGQEKDD